MANTAGKKAGQKTIAKQVKAGETADTSKDYSSPNWKEDTKNTTLWKKE